MRSNNHMVQVSVMKLRRTWITTDNYFRFSKSSIEPHQVELARRKSSLSMARMELLRSMTTWQTFRDALQSPSPNMSLVRTTRDSTLPSASTRLVLPSSVSAPSTSSSMILKSWARRWFSGCFDWRKRRRCRWNSSQAVVASLRQEFCDIRSYWDKFPEFNAITVLPC